MPLGLKRYQYEGDDHFITFSCYRREAYFAEADAKDTFLNSLELIRRNYCFEVLGYVVMPEHVHLLVSEPLDHETPLSKGLQALKISVAMRVNARPFWQRRCYDFNVFTHNKRGLVERPEEWGWSSYRHYLLDESGPVRITRL